MIDLGKFLRETIAVFASLNSQGLSNVPSFSSKVFWSEFPVRAIPIWFTRLCNNWLYRALTTGVSNLPTMVSVAAVIPPSGASRIVPTGPRAAFTSVVKTDFAVFVIMFL